MYQYGPLNHADALLWYGFTFGEDDESHGQASFILDAAAARWIVAEAEGGGGETGMEVATSPQAEGGAGAKELARIEVDVDTEAQAGVLQQLRMDKEDLCDLCGRVRPWRIKAKDKALSNPLLAIVRCICTTTAEEYATWANDYRLAGERPLSRRSESQVQRILGSILAESAAPYTAALSKQPRVTELPVVLRAKAADARRLLLSERACLLATARRCTEAAAVMSK